MNQIPRHKFLPKISGLFLGIASLRNLLLGLNLYSQEIRVIYVAVKWNIFNWVGNFQKNICTHTHIVLNIQLIETVLLSVISHFLPVKKWLNVLGNMDKKTFKIQCLPLGSLVLL